MSGRLEYTPSAQLYKFVFLEDRHNEIMIVAIKLRSVFLETPYVRFVVQRIRLFHVTGMTIAANHTRRISDARIDLARRNGRRYRSSHSAIRPLLHHRSHGLHGLRSRRWRSRRHWNERGRLDWQIVHGLHYFRSWNVTCH